MVEEVVSEVTASRKYCPICANVMVYKEYLGFMCWVCPDEDGCGYFEIVEVPA